MNLRHRRDIDPAVDVCDVDDLNYFHLVSCHRFSAAYCLFDYPSTLSQISFQEFSQL